MSKEVMQMALDTFNKSKRSHYYCEDRFYSCPQHEEGCADALEGDECNCGANFVNETIDKTIDALRTALAQPDVPETAFGETEPVAWMHNFIDDVIIKNRPTDITCNAGRWTALYTAPPQREWVGLTDDEVMSLLPGAVRLPPGWADTVRAIEAKLKEKNT